MRITEAAKRLGTSARMLRYRESLGLLPPVQPGHRGHRQFTERDMEAVATALALERRFDISPAALAFGLKVLAEPAVRAAVADLGERTGRIGRARALDFEQERALRMIGAGPSLGTRPRQGLAPARPTSSQRPRRGMASRTTRTRAATPPASAKEPAPPHRPRQHKNRATGACRCRGDPGAPCAAV